MKNYRFIMGLVIIAIFLLNIGYIYQSFALNTDTNTNYNQNNKNKSKQISNSPQITVDSAGNLHVNTQSSPSYIMGSQQQRRTSSPSQNMQPASQITTATGLNAVNISNSQNANYLGLWYSQDWNYRKNITISKNAFTAIETNFPYLLDIYDKDLKLALNSGFDILFTDTANNKLPYERITFNRNYNATDAHLMVWIKDNFSNLTNTVIFMYFGNPFSPDQQNPVGTWSNGYQAVYHLNNVGTIIDSSGHYNGTAYTGNSAMPSSDLVSGIIGNGIYFDGNSNITLGNINSNNWTGLTIEVWVNVAALKTVSSIVTKQDSSTNVWSITTGKSGKFSDIITTDNNTPFQVSNYPSTGINSNTWYALGLTWNASTNSLMAYYNGAQQSGSVTTTTGASILDSSLKASIGSSGFNGIIDEVRISSVTRSPTWLYDSQYNEQNPGKNFNITSIDKLLLEGNWSFNQLNYRKNITIPKQNIPQTFYDYPFLITRNDTDLYNQAQSTGTDILFADANGTRLDQEIESYIKGTTTSTIVVWIKIPILSSTTNTTIYMYYGNSTVKRYDISTNVWSNYSAVWHLSDSGSTIKDSTGNGYTGASNGNVLGTGKIANGQDFNGNNYISIASSSLSSGSDVFITGWFKLNSAFNSANSNTQLIMSKYLNSTYNTFIALAGRDFNSLTTGVPKGSLVFKVEQGPNMVYTWTNQTSWLANKWYQFSVILHTQVPTTNKIYINGLDDTNSSFYICSSCSISIGYYASWNLGGGTVATTDVLAGTASFNGSLDEFRISNNAISNTEINFTYNLENNPIAFSSFGSPVYYDFSPPIFTSWGVTDPGNGYPTFWVDIYEKSTIVSAYISINNTAYALGFNGTKIGYTSTYVFQFTDNLTYDNTYNYSIINATDSLGYFQNHFTSVNDFIVNYVKPSISVTSLDFYPNEGKYGTFKANATDIWPGLSYVQVWVQCSVYCPSPYYTNMTYNDTSGFYETSSLYLIGQAITFKIVAFDIAGNNLTTGFHQGTVNDLPPYVYGQELYSTTGTVIYSNETLSLKYNYSDPENNTDSSLIYWYKNNFLQPSFNNSKGIPNSDFKKGDEWYASIKPYDGLIYNTTVNTTVITIQNTPPTVSASLTAVQSNQILTPTFLYSDYDKDKLNYSIWWYNASTLVTALNNASSVSSSYLKKNEIWYFRIGVSDGENTTYRNSNAVPIKNTPPILTGIPGINPKIPDVGGYLIANYSYLYYDYDGDPLNITGNFSPWIIWYFNGTAYHPFDNLSIINLNDTHPYDSLIYYTIQVYDGFNFSILYKSGTCKEGKFADYYAPEIIGLPYFGYQLNNNNNYTCDFNCTSLDSIGIYYTYYDKDGSPEYGTLYRWYLDVGGSWQLQTQYNDMKILPNGTFIHGQIWYVNVTVYDGSNYGTPESSGNLTIIDILPVFSSYSIQVLDSYGNYVSTDNTTTDKNLYAMWNVFDADGDSLQIESYWNNGTENYYSDSSFLPSNMTYKGQTWTFSIRAWDGYNWSTWLNLTIMIVDSPPVISGLTFTGGENVTQTIYINYLFSDLDNDPKGAIITWYVNDFPYETNLTSFSDFKAGDLVYVNVTGFDGQLKGNTLTSIKITIGDAIPYIPINSLYLYQDNNRTNYFYANSSLDVNLTVIDSDGYQIGFGLYAGSEYYLPGYGATYQWYLNGSLTSYTSYYIPVQDLHKYDSWVVCVIPKDQASEVGLRVCSPTINIINSPPIVSPITWNNYYPTKLTNLQISFTDSDVNNDPLQINIFWYVNDSIISTNNNSYTLSSNNFFKNENVTVVVSVFDGENYTFREAQILILDSLPIVTSMNINNNINLYTNDSLTLNWSYYDADGDIQLKNQAIIQWYMYYLYNPNVVYNETNLINNSRTVSSIYTAKGEIWFARIAVFDGQKYSIFYNSTEFGTYFILDSPPIIISLYVNSPNEVIYRNISLIANYSYYDNDGDPNYLNKIYIVWYENGIVQPAYNNLSIIPSTDTMKGESWYYKIEVFDGTVYSILYISPSITIQDAPPYAKNIGFVFQNSSISSSTTRYFYLTNENMTFTYQFIDIDNDPNMSAIYWYKDNILMPQFDNQTTIPFWDLTNGSVWYVELVLADGQIDGATYISPNIYILGAPYAVNFYSQIPPNSDNDPEGIYQIIVNTNTTFEPVTQVTVTLDPNLQNDSSVQNLINSLQSTNYNLGNNNSDTWSLLDLNLFANNPASFENFIGKTILLKITVYTNVTDPHTGLTYKMWRIYYLSIRFEDQSPPVVHDVTVNWNNPNNPSSIIFTAIVTDYGSGVQNVTIYYYFEPLSGSSSNNSNLFYKFMSNSSIPADGMTILLQYIGNSQYQATVPFHGNSSVAVIYYIKVFDKNGNFNNDAYPIGRISPLNFIYKSPGLSIINVGLIIFIILILASLITFVGIKKFRKTEIVGLDIDKVMDEANKLKDYEVQTYLNSHTLGIIVSIFHQTHGPLPIFALPTILTDNIDKLIDLSDRSFSAVRFVEDFTSEMQITFDYSISAMTRIVSFSWGFSLERPDARGGAENITFNILLHKPFDAIVSQFIAQLDPLVHEIHTILDKNEENKELIEQQIDNIRSLISKIILAYQKIYPEGTEGEDDLADTK